MLDDAAAVGGAAHGDVVEAEPVEDGGDGADHVRGAEHVAAEVEDDVVVLAFARRGGQPPRALLRQGGQVLGKEHLAVLTRDIVGHVGLRAESLASVERKIHRRAGILLAICGMLTAVTAAKAVRRRGWRRA